MKVFNRSNLTAFLVASAALPALAQEATAHAGMFDQRFATALGLGIAALGGALGQAKIAAAALEGIARNPGARDKIFTPMIIGLALVESLVIYAFVIALIK